MPDMPQIYAWTETADDGYEGVIVAAVTPFRGVVGLVGEPLAPLQHNRLDIAMKFKELAEAHAKASGNRVRLVRFARAETIEEIDP